MRYFLLSGSTGLLMVILFTTIMVALTGFYLNISLISGPVLAIILVQRLGAEYRLRHHLTREVTITQSRVFEKRLLDACFWVTFVWMGVALILLELSPGPDGRTVPDYLHLAAGLVFPVLLLILFTWARLITKGK